MPINTEELLDGLSILLDEENMKVAIKETGKGRLVCATAFIGGLIAGPIGLAIGGIIGGISAASLTKGKFKPISKVINEMDDSHRQVLAQKISLVISELNIMDAITLVAFITGDPSTKQIVLKTVKQYVTKELKLQIAN